MKKWLKRCLWFLAVVGFFASYSLMHVPTLRWVSVVLSPIVGVLYLYLTLGEKVIKAVKDKSLYEKTYNDFFSGFANENGKIQGINKTMKFVERILCVVSVASATHLTYVLVISALEQSSIVNGVLFLVITTGLAVHFHDANKLTQAIGKKNRGEAIGPTELRRMRTLGKIGRYSHFMAFGAMLVYLFLLAIKMPVFLIMVPLVPFWAYLTIYTGYGALYSAMTDYVLGTRKQFCHRD